ncbi:MAG: asparagine synthase (glutamine-hydrolyzing) [Phycisphaerales bacterium]|nr:asparagine synthase (glutamine-hydrolyzing) [Phycisphaerales bacterium]
MCGIGGVLRVWQSAGEAPPSTFDAIPEAWLDVLDESVRHRGPDGCGRFRQRVVRASGEVVDVALVHRRLSIIDHAGGAQPMVIGAPHRAATPERAAISERAATARERSSSSLDTPALISREGEPYQPLRAHVCPTCGPGVVAVVFNGCIYNHRELRRELEAAGHEFFTDHSDTEVLLHGWREWGPEILGRLEGMFALAAWGEGSGLMALARDPFGEKPLYVMPASERGEFWFASAVAGLARVAVDEAPSTVWGGSLPEWLRFGYHALVTPIPRVEQVSRASFIETRPSAGLERARVERRRLGPKFAARVKRSLPVPGPSRSTRDRIDGLLRAAVAARMEADVPVGCLLSGGVDSSLVSHFAATVGTSGPLTTICVRMPDARYDESVFAGIVAARLGTRHVIVDADANPVDDLRLLVRTVGLPFGDSSLLPTYWACRAAAGQVGVLLTGDGGDELFLGYERYITCRVLDACSVFGSLRVIGAWLAGVLPRRDPRSVAGKLARFLLANAAGAGREYRDLLAIFCSRDSHRLLRSAARDLDESWVSDAIDARAYDLEHHFPGDMLRKLDTASMLAGVEVRAPFLDTTLAEAALALPPQRLMPRGRRKGLLRAVARRYLPAEIVDRPKMGFAIPIGEWFRTDYGGMRQLLYDHLESADPFPRLAEAGVELNMRFVRRMLREHDAAGEQSINPWHGRDHSQRLYMLLVLSIWCTWLRELRAGG